MKKISPQLKFEFEKNFTKISPNLKRFLMVPVGTIKKIFKLGEIFVKFFSNSNFN